MNMKILMERVLFQFVRFVTLLCKFQEIRLMRVETIKEILCKGNTTGKRKRYCESIKFKGRMINCSVGFIDNLSRSPIVQTKRKKKEIIPCIKSCH